VNLGGLHFTGDRLAGVAAIAVLGVVVVRRGLNWTPVHSALLLFTGVQVLTSVLAAPQWPPGPRFASVYVLGFACFALAAAWAADRHGLRQAVRGWIALGAVIGFAGAVLATVANLRGARVWGTGVAQELSLDGGGSVAVFACKVMFIEWNLYSSFLLVAFALALWAWAPGRTAGFWIGWISVAGIVLGLVFGLTRAAWIATGGIALFWLWARRPPARQVGALVLAAALGLLAQAVAIGASPLQFRVMQPIQTLSDRNLSVRGSINRATLESWSTSRLLGKGAGSTNGLEVRGAGWKPWNGNLALFVLHDSGLVGAVALAGLLIVAIRTAGSALGRSSDRAVHVALLAAGVALLWAYQFTHGLWLMYPYVYLGLLTASSHGAAPLATGQGEDVAALAQAPA
jgi:MFS family permease